jgi:uncharacterized protein YhaN
MATPVEVSHLEMVLQAALEAGPIEKQMAEMHASSQALEGELNGALKRQTLWSGSLAQVEAVPLPSQATVDRFEARFDDLQRRLERLREAMASTEGEIAQTVADIQAIDLAQEVPTETDLKTIRGLRDNGWRLIRGQLECQIPSDDASQAVMRHFDDVSDLPDAFEKSMVRADTISDRLRREAKRVEKKGLLEARKTKLEKSLADIVAECEKSLPHYRAWESEWHNVWEPACVIPQTTREMRSWLSDIDALRDKLIDWRSKKAQSERLADQLAVLKADLIEALEQAGIAPAQKHPLPRLIKTAQAFIKDQKRLESEIASADKELNRLKAELEEGASAVAQLEGTLSQWQTSWESGVNKIGIRPDVNPTGALAVIECIREVRSKTSDADVLRKRIVGIDHDSAEFTARVDALVDALAPDLKAESQVRAAELLNGRLTHAHKDASTHLGLTERLDSLKKEQEDTQRRLFECRALIESLRQEANCESAASIAETETRAQERKALVRQLNELERQLRKLSAGATLEAFIDEASLMDPDAIDPELQELANATQALEKERSELDQHIGALKATLERMDGRSEAAIHAENAERLLAGLESDVEKFARLKIASIILSRTVEQYREKHQGPLISRASELFSQMTLGSFGRLQADYDAKGNPVLVGVRSGSGVPVGVEGMSDGTADQLYLALRLASLEQYLEHNEPLPFVVDDILLRFDDARALATLDVLASLAEKTQVLFFTHHRHLVELAGGSQDTRLRYKLHRLG